jgi:hypothetical protein
VAIFRSAARRNGISTVPSDRDLIRSILDFCIVGLRKQIGTYMRGSDFEN